MASRKKLFVHILKWSEGMRWNGKRNLMRDDTGFCTRICAEPYCNHRWRDTELLQIVELEKREYKTEERESNNSSNAKELRQWKSKSYSHAEWWETVTNCKQDLLHQNYSQLHLSVCMPKKMKGIQYSFLRTIIFQLHFSNCGSNLMLHNHSVLI